MPPLPNIPGRRSGHTRSQLLARLLLTVCSVSGIVVLDFSLQAQSATEAAVKAAFVYNLTKYVEWFQPGKDLVIVVIGDGPMPETLRRMLDGKISQSRTIRVVLSQSEAVPETCDLLYLARVPPKKLQPVLNKERSNGVLTVGDTSSFAREGGMVGLLTVGDHIEMEINLEAVQAAHLKVSSHLLALTSLVHRVSIPAAEKPL